MAVPPSQFITARVPYLAWTGFYVGINGGGGLGPTSQTLTVDPLITALGGSPGCRLGKLRSSARAPHTRNST
jgi:hypothetical protein